MLRRIAGSHSSREHQPLLSGMRPRSSGEPQDTSTKSNSLKLGLLVFRGMLGPFLALLFPFLFGGRIALETLGDLLVHFWPDLVDIQDFLFEKQAPSKIFLLSVDEIDQERAFAGGGGRPQFVGVGPVVDNKRIEAAPVSRSRDVDLGLGVGKVANDEIGILVALDFLEAALAEFAGDRFMYAVANFVGVHLEHDKLFHTSNVGKRLELREIEIGVEVDIRLGLSVRGE